MTNIPQDTIEAMREVIRISDRKHDAWDKVKEYLSAAPSAPNEAQLSVTQALEELERALCVIGVVGKIDGYDVIRRESVIDIARHRIRALIPSAQTEK